MRPITNRCLAIRWKKVGIKLRRWELVDWFGDVVESGLAFGSEKSTRQVARDAQKRYIEQHGGFYKAKHKRV